MARQFHFFPSMQTRDVEIDRTKENLLGAGIGTIGGAIFGAAIGAITGTIATGGPGAIPGAIMGAKTGAIAGAAPGLTQEATDYFLPPTQQVQVQRDFGIGYATPKDPWIGSQPPQALPIDYMAQMSLPQQAPQYTPSYSGEMQRYG